MKKIENKNDIYSYCPLLDVTKFIFSLVIVIYHYNYFVLKWKNEIMFGGGISALKSFL